MNISASMCQNTPPLFLNIPTDLPVFRSRHQKEKVIVVMGATGTGKSRLSMDLATRFPAEVINSDKMQVYKGLDIVTNKITDKERCGVPHHLLGIIDPNTDFPVTKFCNMASSAVRSISGRGQLPIIAGGSNSYIEALIDSENSELRSRYECCFLWVDVAPPVLHSVVFDRVDRMVELGMIEELREMFDPNADYSKGIRRAIGVPEFDKYFRYEKSLGRYRLLKEAIEDTKMNTWRLACRQLEKIWRLRNLKGWNIMRIDATEVFRKKGREAEEAWGEMVLAQSLVVVNRFLNNFEPNICVPSKSRVMAMRPTLAGKTH
ncbi:hypothetical protein LguiA_011472 [Lonicera macranthoides]